MTYCTFTAQRFSGAVTFLAVALAATLPAASANAQMSRTFVSGHGADTNPCSLAAPCRSFAQAASQTRAGGEISILDPAGYGPVTITQALTIVNDGVGEAGVTATTGNAITINAGANDVVNLRGLTLVGSGAGDGVEFATGAGLNMQNCVIRGFSGNGLYAHPNTPQFYIGYINVLDSIVSNNGSNGILITPSGGGTVTASLKRILVSGNGEVGLAMVAPVAATALTGTLEDSGSSNNAIDGIEVLSNGSSVTLTMANSQIVNNATGAIVGGGAVLATLNLSGNTFVGNTTTAYSIIFTGGTINSYGNNYITSNTNNGGSLTSLSDH